MRDRSIEVSRVIDVPAEAVFAFLARPANHVLLDTSGMIRGAASDGVVTRLGEVFVMNMSNSAKGDHQVENHVVVYEPDRAIGWAPAEPGRPPAGHTWTWRLVPVGRDQTVVSLAYDWSAFTHLDHLDDLPVLDAGGLRASLDLLAAALERQ